jgi:hypothetical protein
MNGKNRSIFLKAFLSILLLSLICGCTLNQSPSSTQITFTPASTHTPEPLWQVSNSTDEMTGEKSFFTISPKISPTEQMDSPYDDVVAWIGVSCSGSKEWEYIGFSTAPNLTNTEIKDGYDKISTRIKWDNSIENAEFLQTWGDKFLSFYDPQNGDEEIIQKLQTHNSLLLELDWYGEGPVYFNFPLEGAKEGIDSIRLQCSGG